MIMRKRFALSLLVCVILCLCLTPAVLADGQTEAELRAAIARGDKSFDMSDKGDVSLSANLEIPAGFFVNAMGGTRIIVPTGKTLMNYGTMEIDGLKLTGGAVEVRGGIFRVNGKLERSGGTVKVYNGFNLFPAADVWPDNTGIFSYPEGTGKTSLLFAASNGDELAAALDTANELTERFLADVNVRGNCVLSGTHSVPHQGNIRVQGDQNGSLTVAEGAALTYASGGNVFLYNGAAAAVNGVLICNGGVTVEPNCTLTVNGIMETGGLYLGGTVELRENCIFRTNREFHPEGGSIQVLGRCFNLFPAADVWPDHTDVIVYPEGAVETNLSFQPTSDAEFGAAVSAVNAFTGKFVGDISVQNALALTSQHTLTRKAEIRVAGGKGGRLTVGEDAALIYDNCGGNVFLENNGNVQCAAVSENNGVIAVNNIEVQPGCLLRSSGIVDIASLKLGGVVEVRGGIFRVNRTLERNGGTVQVYDGFNLFPAADVWPDHTDVIVYPENEVTTSLYFQPTNEDEFSDAVSAVNAFPANYAGDIGVNNQIALAGRYALTHRAELRVNSGKGGALTLEQGAQLSYDGCGGNLYLYNNSEAGDMPASFICGTLQVNTVEVQSGCVLVLGEGSFTSTIGAWIDGRLVNDGMLELHKRYGGTEPRMMVTGEYRGGGTIGVLDYDTDSYFDGMDLRLFEKIEDDRGTLYVPYPIDLALPADLTAIGAEAFSGGAFGSVYIPEGVTSIAPTAFDGAENLTIYGAAGSEAERFAQAQGFAFTALW